MRSRKVSSFSSYFSFSPLFFGFILFLLFAVLFYSHLLSVLNKLLQANIEKMSSEKDAILRLLETVKYVLFFYPFLYFFSFPFLFLIVLLLFSLFLRRAEKSRLEKDNLDLLIEKEQQREEKLEIVLSNQKLSLELQTAKSSVKEVCLSLLFPLLSPSLYSLLYPLLSSISLITY